VGDRNKFNKGDPFFGRSKKIVERISIRVSNNARFFFKKPALLTKKLLSVPLKDYRGGISKPFYNLELSPNRY
jgi:hypothetical protein